MTAHTVNAVTMLRTADGRWTVEVLRTRGGECFRVRQPLEVPGRSTWNPIGQICATIDEVRAALGDEAFATLREV